MAAQNSALSAHCAKMSAKAVLTCAGYRLWVGASCSSTWQISVVSQYMSQPICNTGVLRYPPVSAVRSGLGMITGMITDCQASCLKPSTARIFSENGDIG